MAKLAQDEFNPNTFLRNTPLDILEEFLQIKHPDLAKQEQFIFNDSNKFEEFFDSLPPESQEYLTLVNDIATEKGMPHLIEACSKFNLALDINNLVPHAIALKMLSLNEKAFDEAYGWYSISQIDNYKDYKGKEDKKITTKNISLFKSDIIDSLKKEARGNNINIEMYTNEDCFAMIIYFGNYLKNYDLFEDGEFVTKKQRHAKSLTLIYYHKTGKLRLKTPLPKLGKLVISLFAKYFLEDETFFYKSHKCKFFNLNLLKYMKPKDLLTCPSDNIAEVIVKRLHIYLNSDKFSKLFIEFPDDIHTICEERNFDIDELIVYHAEVQFKFANSGPSNSKIYKFTEPNISNINDSPRDKMVRKYFIKWKIIND